MWILIIWQPTVWTLSGILLILYFEDSPSGVIELFEHQNISHFLFPFFTIIYWQTNREFRISPSWLKTKGVFAWLENNEYTYWLTQGGKYLSGYPGRGCNIIHLFSFENYRSSMYICTVFGCALSFLICIWTSDDSLVIFSAISTVWRYYSFVLLYYGLIEVELFCVFLNPTIFVDYKFINIIYLF